MTSVVVARDLGERSEIEHRVRRRHRRSGLDVEARRRSSVQTTPVGGAHFRRRGRERTVRDALRPGPSAARVRIRHAVPRRPPRPRSISRRRGSTSRPRAERTTLSERRRRGERGRVAVSGGVHHDRGLDVPAGAAQQPLGILVLETGDDGDDAARPVARLLAAGLQVDHQVAVGLADAHHGDGGQHVEHHLGRGPGLEPCRAGDDLRSDRGSYHHVDEGLQLGSGPAGDEDDPGSAASGACERTPDETGHAAGRHANEHVPARRPETGDGAAAFLVAILDALLRVEECRPPPPA